MNESIAKTLAVLPDKPGVYIMRDEHGKIIYIGKAVRSEEHTSELQSR